MDWEEKLPDEVQKMFNRFKKEAKSLEEIVIPRWVGTNQGAYMEILGFCDASGRGYGYAIYGKLEGKARILLRGGNRVTRSKKTRTLPKLELEGATLLAKALEELLLIFGSMVKTTPQW